MTLSLKRSALACRLLAAFGMFACLVPAGVFAAGNANNLVRIQVASKAESDLLPRGLDISGSKPCEWVDALVTDQQMSDLASRGFFVQLLSKDVNQLLRDAAESYPTWTQFQTDLNNIVNSHPSICTMDTIGYSYEGRPIQAVKLSDNVSLDESEPEVLLTGLTHAREWPGLVTSMFILDSLTEAYSLTPSVTTMVDSREIWFIPCINPDGYVYTRDVGIDWRRNRRPFPEYGSIGVDLNRNYGGTTNGSPKGQWGSVIGSVSHNPFDETYCGPSPFSEPETQAERDFILSRDFCAGITYHTYSELVLWQWGYGSDAPPNLSYIAALGTGIANLIVQEDYSGFYTPQSSFDLYATSGDATDWGYGRNHYVEGSDMIFFTIEIGQEFQPPTLRLAQIVRENFDGAFYLLQEAGDIRNDLAPRVIPPVVAPMLPGTSGNYTIEWQESNPSENPTKWQIDELTSRVVYTEGAEGSTTSWTLDGFTVSSARAHSGTKSFRSSAIDERADALTANQAYNVKVGDSLTFWTWYDIEEDYDKGHVEVSLDGRKFDVLASYTGQSGAWSRKAYSLSAYVGKSIFIRFRYTTDAYQTEEGFYVDDIYPALTFGSTTTLSANVTDTFYTVTGKAPGEYYYRVRGYNPTWSWCDFSTLKPKTVITTNIGTLAGTVTDSVGGGLLTGVLIEVLQGMIVVESGFTANGAYEIQDMTTGTYTVRASSPYFETKSTTGVQVVPQQTTVVDFALASNRGSIAGLVTDSVSVEPLAGASVEVRLGTTLVGSATANGLGYYSVDTLLAGSYNVTSTMSDYQAKTITNVPVIARQSTGLNLPLMPMYLCGDVDASGETDIDDVVFLITFVFASGPAPVPEWIGDVECSGMTDIDDIVYLITYIFAGGPAPCAGC